MTTEQTKEIIAYLSGPRDYAEGVAIYSRFGVNLRLKRQFAIDNTMATREILFDELRKLAGLTEIEFDRLPRLAVSHSETIGAVKLPDSGQEPAEELQDIGSGYDEAPEPVRKMIRFREKYAFLNSPDCPDVLKILVADMFTAYGEYKAAHARLQTLGDADSATAAADCEKVVLEYLKNREIRDELDYYRENGTILGKATKSREARATEDLTVLSDVDLISKLQSANVQASKNKKKLADAKAKGEEDEKAAAALEYWSSYKQALKTEVDRRKKK